MKLNHKDGGCRRFILIECEGYADELTAERIRRVIKGYKFTGTQREELMSEPLTLASVRGGSELLSKADSYHLTDGHRFDRISKKIEDGAFKVFGERQISSKCDGLGGSFTFCELGPEISVEGMLTGEKLPDYASLARYVFYTASGKTLDRDVAAPRRDWFIGETEAHRLHLIYKPDKDWLRTNEAALNMSTAELIAKSNASKKRALVFAAVKYVGQRELLAQYGIEFCQLPYAIHRILGD